MPIIRHGYSQKPRQGTTTQRGYGHTHQQTRARLLPLAYHTACPLCGDPMLPGQPLELHHTTSLLRNPTSTGDAITHRHCNRRQGGA